MGHMINAVNSTIYSSTPRCCPGLPFALPAARKEVVSRSLSYGHTTHQVYDWQGQTDLCTVGESCGATLLKVISCKCSYVLVVVARGSWLTGVVVDMMICVCIGGVPLLQKPEIG